MKKCSEDSCLCHDYTDLNDLLSYVYLLPDTNSPSHQGSFQDIHDSWNPCTCSPSLTHNLQTF